MILNLEHLLKFQSTAINIIEVIYTVVLLPLGGEIRPNINRKMFEIIKKLEHTYYYLVIE
jgi:hypothetical protein